MQNDSCTGGPHRVAEGDGAAVDVQPLPVELAQVAVEAELLPAVLVVLPRREAAEYLRGEGLVDLPVIEVVQPQAVALQDRRRRVHRPKAHLRRVEPRPLRVDY